MLTIPISQEKNRNFYGTRLEDALLVYNLHCFYPDTASLKWLLNRYKNDFAVVWYRIYIPHHKTAYIRQKMKIHKKYVQVFNLLKRIEC